MTWTATPREASRRAAARPSLPLLPLPAMTTTRLPYAPPSMRSAAQATAEPARSINVSTGVVAAASISRICSGVTIGTMTRQRSYVASMAPVADRPPSSTCHRRVALPTTTRPSLAPTTTQRGDDLREASLGDDVSDRDQVAVGQREVPCAHSRARRQRRCGARDGEGRRARWRPSDPHLVEPERAQPDTECFHHRLPCGEARR